MKTNSFLLFYIRVLLAISLASPAFCQGTFQDLNFESPVLPLVPAFGVNPTYYYSSNAMPGWSLYYDISMGPTQADVIFYNDISLGDVSIDLLGPGSGEVTGPIIDGSYTAVLQAGVFNSSNASASIAQTGLIPLNTKSLLVNEITKNAPVLVTIDGQNIPMFALSTTNISGVTSTIFGGDISAFAGQTETLELTSPDSPDEFNEVSLDDIEFSLTSIPEPGTDMLLLSGGALFAFNRWRRRTS